MFGKVILTFRIILLVNGKARIQIQGCLTPEAMLFELYHIKWEINQTRETP